MEFALLLPVLLILVLAVIEFCTLVFGLSSARYAAGEGTRAASEAGSNASADSLAVAAIRATGLGSTRVVSVSEVDIYKVDLVNGNLQQDSVMINRYQLDGTPIGVPPWSPSTRSTSASRPEYIGVTIRYTYNWKDGLLGSFLQPLNLNSISWGRLEPANF
ncbi:MAG: pilus assembly protein [Candidatus Dormibacteraeota bacterium]|nr:pilus assembly protein [Candidatus Dormibacteraeota bacterium]